MIGAPKRIFELAAGDITVSIHDEFLNVWQQRPLQGVDELLSIQAELTSLLESCRLKHIMFDARDATPDSVEVRDAMQEWFETSPVVERVAVLSDPASGITSRSSAAAAETAAVRSRVRVFHDEAEAEHWLAHSDAGANLATALVIL